MSKQIDERVVSMQFDNRNFEKNVSTTLSTLDKLKQKLNFTGSAKGLENIGTATKNIKMDGLAKGVETVRAKFSALEVMGVTTLANIANSAVNAGKRMVKALTIDPVMDGFREYEMMLNTVQTTMAATGLTAKEVEKELEKLDIYADKTVYSTADMMNNLPKFTNAGVELSKAVTAMIGIANATALAGGDASKASIAFYNLGQAIGTGYLTRMDYNSINNAGIATMEWKNQMVKAAIAAGTLKKAGEDAYIAGGKTFTLQQLFIDGLQKQWATTDVMMKVFGDYGDETTEIGKKSYSAAQDIKTFTMMMESLKASVGTGWKDTWQLIFGDLDGAKALWSGVYKFISKITDGMTNFRNTILESAFTKGFTNLVDKVNSVTKPLNKAVDAIKDYKKVVNEIIRGDWGNGQSRWDKLTKAGYDWAHAQNLVNEKLGVSLRRQTKYKEGQTETAKSTEKLTEKEANRIAQLATLSEAELKSLGYTDKQIQAFRELTKAADQVGLPLEEFLLKIDEIDGRWLFLNSFKNIGEAMSQFASVIGQAWNSIFPNSMDSIANAIFNIISAFHKFTTGLGGFIDESGKLTESGENLKRTFEGIFAAIDIVTTIFGGGFKIAFKLVSSILGMFNLDILDVTAYVADFIVMIRDWIDSVLDVGKIFEFAAPYIRDGAEAIRDFFKSLKDSDKIQNIIAMIRDIGSAIKDKFVGLKDSKFKEIGKNIVQGLAQGIKDGAKHAWDAIVSIATGLITKICDILDINSPSLVFAAIGGFIIAGLIMGILNGFPQVGEAIKNAATTCIDTIKNIDFGAIFAGSLVAGIIVVGYKLAKALEAITSPFEGLGDFLTDTGKGLKKAFKGLGKTLNGLGFKMQTQGILNIAIAIGILAAAIFVLAQLDTKSLLTATAVIAILAGVLTGLAVAIGKLGPKESIELGKFSLTVLGMAAAIAIVAYAVKSLSGMSWEEWAKGLGGVVAVVGVFAAIMASTKLLTGSKNVDKIGGTILKIAAAIMLMALVAKIIAGMSWDEMGKAGAAIGAFGLIIVGLMAATKLISGSKNVDKIGGSILKVAGAMLVMVIVAKIAAGMSKEEMLKGGAAILAFSGIIVGLMVATKLINGSKNVGAIGGTIFKIAAALLVMTVVAKIAARMSKEEIIKGGAAILAFSGIIVGLMAATKLINGSKNVGKIGGAILLISIAIGIMAATAALLSMISIEGLAKGIIAVGLLSGMVAGLIYVTKFSKDCKGSLIAITAAIAALTLSIIALSFIKTENLVKATAAIAVLLGMLALVIKASSNMSSSIGSLIVITVAISILSFALYHIAHLPTDQALAASASLSMVLLSLAVAMAIISKAGSMSIKAAASVAFMVIVIYALTHILELLSDIQAEQALSGTLALSALLVAMTVVLAALTLIGKNAAGALVGVAAISALTLVVFALGAIIKWMCETPLDAAMPAIKALVVLLLGMSAVLVVLTAVGSLGAGALIGVAAIAVLSLVVVALGAIIKWMCETPLDSAASAVSALTTLLLGMSAVLVVLTVVGSLGPGAFIGIAALSTMIVALGALIVGIGALVDKFPQLETFLDKGIPILEKIGHALGSFFGNIIGGLLEGIGDSLPNLAASLSSFMVGLTPFIIGAKMIDDSVIDGVKNLVEAILLITATDVLNGLTSWLTGGDSLATFGEQLVPFGKAMVDFSSTVSGKIDEGAVTAAASAGKAIAEMQKTLPGTGGVLQWFAGEKDMAQFGDQLVAFGTAIAGFSKAVSGDGTINEAAVTAAANAGKVMAGFQSELVGTGGVVQWFCGEKDMAQFGDQLVAFGTALVGFSKVVSSEGAINETAITAAANAGAVMSELQNSLNANGGVVDFFAGGKDLGNFGEQITSFGESLVSFSNTVSGNIDEEAVTAATNAGRVMAELQSAIPKDKLFDGSVSMEDFGKDIEEFGKGIKGYSDEIEDINITNVNASISAAKIILEIAKSASVISNENIDKFKKIETIGTSISKYSSSISKVNISKVNESAKAANTLVTLINSLAGIDTSGVATFKSAVDSLSKTNFAGIEKAFSGSSTALENAGKSLINSIAKGMKSEQSTLQTTAINIVKSLSEPIKTTATSFVKSGSEFVTNLDKGVSSKKNTVKNTLTKIMNSCVTSIRSYYSKFKSAGSYVVDGFAAGISANTFKAKAKAKAMAEAALEAAREVLRINSPSKAFRDLGLSVPEGFALGISKMANAVKSASVGMSNVALNSVKSSISRISNIINSDIDAQPTIRPVVDLSDVTASANSISGLFDMNPSIGVMANARSINTMMNRNQNGSNSEVVSAINELKKSMGKTSGDTYNINGVTYDDGSNITEAVSTLIRAARIERRT